MIENDESLRRWLAREWHEANDEWLQARREYERQAATESSDPARLLQARCRLDYADWRRGRLAEQYVIEETLLDCTTQRVSTR